MELDFKHVNRRWQSTAPLNSVDGVHRSLCYRVRSRMTLADRPPVPGCSQAAELGAALWWHQVTHSGCLHQISTRNREKVAVPWTPGSSPAVDHHRLSNRREARPRSVIWTYVHLDDFCQQFPSIRTLIPFLLFQPAWLTQLDMPQNLQRTPLDVSSQSASNGTLLTHLNVK